MIKGAFRERTLADSVYVIYREGFNAASWSSSSRHGDIIVIEMFNVKEFVMLTRCPECGFLNGSPYNQHRCAKCGAPLHDKDKPVEPDNPVSYIANILL